MQIKGTGRPVCKDTLMHVNSPTNKTFCKRLKFNTHDLMSTRNTCNQFSQESQTPRDDFHKTQPKRNSLPLQLNSPSVKASSPARVKCGPRQNNLISTQTMAIRNPRIKKDTKSFQIAILPYEITCDDLINYTNIESRIRNDVLLKYPNNSEPYLSRIGKYIEKYYYNNFIHKKKWPSNLKFKDHSVRTLEDLQRLKNQEKERKINWKPKVFATSNENRHSKMKSLEPNNEDLSKATPSTPRSKRIIESIGDDSSMLINKPVTISPSQISYEDFRKFTNIESCVHEDILRKDPKNAQLHFTRVESYIKKYYDNYFLRNEKWPSRIKFLDKTIGSLDDLERKKCRIRYGNSIQFTKPIGQHKDVKNQSTHDSLKLSNTRDQKITSNKGTKDTKPQIPDEDNATLSEKRLICRCIKPCIIKLSKNMNSRFCDINKYSTNSPSKNNCYMQVHPETCPKEGLTMKKNLRLESSESEATCFFNLIKRKRRSKATYLKHHNVKKRRTDPSDSLNEETMYQSDMESSYNSDNSIDTIIFPLSRIQNPKTSLDASSTIINQDKVGLNSQIVKNELNDNVTNEELGVLRNLCIKLEAATNQEDDLIVLQSEEENTMQNNLISSQLKKLSAIVSNFKEEQGFVANEVILSAEEPHLDIKTEFNDDCSESNFSSYSSDVKIIENQISQPITINDTGDTVDDLLEIIMNRSDTSKKIGLNQRIIKSSCNARNNLKNSRYKSKTNGKENLHGLNIDELIDELAQLMDDFEDHSNPNQDENNHSNTGNLPNDHMKCINIGREETGPIIQMTQVENFVDKSFKMNNSSFELCADSVQNHSAPSTARSSLSTDYVSETTIFSESSVIVPYQSQISTNSSNKSEKAKRKVNETPRVRNFRRTKSIRSKVLNKNTGKSRKPISNRRKSIVIATHQPLPSRKRKFKSISIKLKKDLIATKQDNILRASTGTENMTEDDILQLSEDCEREYENSAAIRLNRKIACHNFQWISSLHWQQVPHTVMLTTYYESSIPLLNVVGVLPLKPKISLWRHQLLRVKIFNDNVHFRMDIDASNEDTMYSLLESSLHGASIYSSMDLVILRCLQTIFEYFPPICLEKQNISIADTTPSAD